MRFTRTQHGRLSVARVALVILWLSCALAASLAPVGLARADGGAPNLAYVVGAGPRGDELAVIDIGQRHVTAHVPIGEDPMGVVLSTDGRFAYVTQAAANRVAVVDAHAHQVVATVPVGSGPTALMVAVVGNANELYVADSGGNTVTIVDADARRVLATVPVGQNPTGVALAGPDSGISNPDDAEIYVANAGSNSVSVISATQRHVIATIAVPESPVSVCVPVSGGVAYVGTRSGSVLALSLADHRLLGTVLQSSHGVLGTMDYDAVTGQVYVPDATSGVVDVLAPVAANSAGNALPAFPAEPARTLGIGGGPAAVAITFEGSFGFVAERTAGRVAMFDPASHSILATVDIGGTPRALVTGPYPPAVSGQTAFILDMVVIGVIFLTMVVVLATGKRRAGQRHAESK